MNPFPGIIDWFILVRTRIDLRGCFISSSRREAPIYCGQLLSLFWAPFVPLLSSSRYLPPRPSSPASTHTDNHPPSSSSWPSCSSVVVVLIIVQSLHLLSFSLSLFLTPNISFLGKKSERDQKALLNRNIHTFRHLTRKEESWLVMI